MSPNLISFVTIRRGNWVMKISVSRTKEVLVVAQHYFDSDLFEVRHFRDQNEAADYIEFLAREDQ